MKKRRKNSWHTRTANRKMDGWMKKKSLLGEIERKKEQAKEEDHRSCLRIQRSQKQQRGAEEKESGENTHIPDTMEQLLENG